VDGFSLDGKGNPQKLFFDHGKDSGLQWSPRRKRTRFRFQPRRPRPDRRLSVKDKFLSWLAPSTDKASMPRWSVTENRSLLYAAPAMAARPSRS